MQKENEEKKPRRRVKKIKGHGGHHGGAWKVAYADFVTAMMALFLVLWLVSQADTKLKEAIANYFRSPGVFNSVKGGILSGPSKVSKTPTDLTSKEDEQALFAVAQQLKKKMDENTEYSKNKDRVKIQMTDEGLSIQVIDKADRVSFPSGSAELTPEIREIIREIARSICDLPNRISIGGHTDKYVFSDSSTYTNWELSADRANAARRILEAECVKPEQIFRIVGYADSMPIVPENPYAPANRRISITVLKMPVEIKETTDEAVETDRDTSQSEPDVDEKPKSKPVKKPRPQTANTNKPETKENPVKTNLDNTNISEKRVNEAKLTNERSVTIGEPDKLPANINKSVVLKPSPDKP
jgi:chemotaxis protein MotB